MRGTETKLTRPFFSFLVPLAQVSSPARSGKTLILATGELDLILRGSISEPPLMSLLSFSGDSALVCFSFPRLLFTRLDALLTCLFPSPTGLQYEDNVANTYYYPIGAIVPINVFILNASSPLSSSFPRSELTPIFLGISYSDTLESPTSLSSTPRPTKSSEVL